LADPGGGVFWIDEGGGGDRLSQSQHPESQRRRSGSEDTDFNQVGKHPACELTHVQILSETAKRRLIRPATPSPSAHLPRAVLILIKSTLPGFSLLLTWVDLHNIGRQGKFCG